MLSSSHGKLDGNLRNRGRESGARDDMPRDSIRDDSREGFIQYESCDMKHGVPPSPTDRSGLASCIFKYIHDKITWLENS